MCLKTYKVINEFNQTLSKKTKNKNKNNFLKNLLEMFSVDTILFN